VGSGCVKIILVSSANSVSLDKLDKLFIEPGKPGKVCVLCHSTPFALLLLT
jgi:hypothetical protein